LAIRSSAFKLVCLSLWASTATAARPNDDCADAFVVSDGDTPFSTEGATTDGPTHANCRFCCSDLQIGSDIWFVYQVSQLSHPQWRSFVLCTSSFDTKIAIYAGDQPCEASEKTLIACNDDSCSVQSKVDVYVNSCESYTIRIGGFDGGTGEGTLKIAQSIIVDCFGFGPCCASHDTGGCDDGSCCLQVCDQDPFCCDANWDQQCVDLAAQHCDGHCGSGDVNNDGTVNVDDLLSVIHTWGPCTSCVFCADRTGNDVVDVDDLLQVINDWS
jgi:hypothetical protein